MAEDISGSEQAEGLSWPWGRAAWSLLAFPCWFLGLTVFALWPSRLGFPAFWRRALEASRSPTTATLRLVLLRILLRRTGILTGRRLNLADARRLVAWLLLPIRHVAPACVRQARDLWRTQKKEGHSPISRGGRLAFLMESMVDSLRYANGRVSRMWFDPDRRPRADFHVPNFFHIEAGCFAVNHALNPTMPLQEWHHDKLALYLLGRARGWRVVPVYASFRDGAVVEHAALDPGIALISKPASLAEGRGVFERWWPRRDSEHGATKYQRDDNATFSLQDLHAHLSALSRTGPYLLQKLLEPHPILRELSGSSTLCTLRLPTCRFRDGRVQTLPMAFLRLPRGAAIFDNMARGGIGYRVDIESGCLAAGGAYGTRETFRVHPTTGRLAAGVELPFFADARALCVAAHAEGLPTFPTVGWDVALTAEGPVLLEANISWATEHNIPEEPCLGETAYAECLLEHLRALWPSQVPCW